METLLEVSHLRVSYHTYQGEVQSVRDVSFHVGHGETVAVVGESGCGKSVSAKSVLRLIKSPGEILEGSRIQFEGQDVLKLDKKGLSRYRGEEASIIFQDALASLNPTMKVGKQIMETLRKHQRISKAEARKTAIQILQRVGIPDAENRVDQYPHQFSGGMKQRAIIAMALACDASVLIADEPTTALDVTIQAQIMDLLKEIQRVNNTSVLLITHDLALVSENADDVAVMYSGRIVESAKCDVYFQTPNHPYSIALLNALPSNNINRLQTIKGQPPAIYHDISGCKFHPRCPKCMDICKLRVPEFRKIGDRHYSACWLN